MGEIKLYYRATTKSEYGKKKWKFIDKEGGVISGLNITVLLSILLMVGI